MWRHPITAKQIRVLQEEWGVRDPEPSEGDTAGVAVANGWFQVIMVCSGWGSSCYELWKVFGGWVDADDLGIMNSRLQRHLLVVILEVSRIPPFLLFLFIFEANLSTYVPCANLFVTLDGMYTQIFSPTTQTKRLNLCMCRKNSNMSPGKS